MEMRTSKCYSIGQVKNYMVTCTCTNKPTGVPLTSFTVHASLRVAYMIWGGGVGGGGELSKTVIDLDEILDEKNLRIQLQRIITRSVMD